MRVLVCLVLLAGCLVRKAEPVAAQKSVGRVLDELFENKALDLDMENGLWKRFLEVNVELNNVSNLLRKAWLNALTASEVEQLAGAVLRGGSKAISEFKMMTVSRIKDSLYMEKEIIQRTYAAIMEMSIPQQKKYFELHKIGDAQGAAAHLKKHTNLANDKIYLRQAIELGEWLDEMAETVADNHRLADAVGQELAGSDALKVSGISASDVVAELKVGTKEFDMSVFSGEVNLVFKMIQDISDVDIWTEFAHLEIMLRRADDGMPVYTKLQKSEIEGLKNPYDKNFTSPVENAGDSGKYLDKLFEKPAAKAIHNDKLLERILEEYPSPTGLAYSNPAFPMREQ